MKSFVKIFPIRDAVVFLICLATVECVNAQIPDVPGWRIIVNDEFNGTNLNATLWEPLDRKDSYNNEKQYYHPNQVTVADGNLNLTAINVPREGKAYQSGLITSKSRYGPGRFEARIDLPTTQGMWPAFWLNANNVSWPLGGEIDIMENRGSQPTLVSSAYHWPVVPGQAGSSQFDAQSYSASSNGMPVNYHNSFHTYAVEWDEIQLWFYVDGVLYHTVNNSEAPIFETPKNIILNLAVGGIFGGDPNGSTVWPQTMLVDYVRVWQKQTGIAGDFNGDGKVNAADYTVWRNTDGQSGIGLPADGSGNGTVGPEDYELWKAHFGGPETPGAASSSQVPEPLHAPEPSSAVPITVGLLFFCGPRRVPPT